MSTEATITADDVRRYVETDLDNTEIDAYISDAEEEALVYNDPRDFEEGQFDRLVKYYTALLISMRQRSGGEKKQLRQGSRQVTLTSPSDMRDRTGWLRGRVRANDPSGALLDGGESRHVSFTTPSHDPYDAGYPEREDQEDS